MDSATPPSPQNQSERIENMPNQHGQPIEKAAAHARFSAKAKSRCLYIPFAQLQQLMSTHPLSFRVPTLESSASILPEPRIISVSWVGTPERYDGNAKLCRPFLTCSLLPSLQPYRFTPIEARVWHAISNLTSRALRVGIAVGDRLTPTCPSFSACPSTKAKVFSFGTLGSDVTICSPCAKRTSLWCISTLTARASVGLWMMISCMLWHFVLLPVKTALNEVLGSIYV